MTSRTPPNRTRRASPRASASVSTRAHGRSRRRILAALLAGALSLSLALAPVSSADVGATIIERCTHGQSLSGFTAQQYRQALRELPTEVEEYSDCANLIRHAELGGAGGAGGGPNGSASATIPLTPAERTALKSAPKLGSVPLVVGDQTVAPGVVHVNIASALSSLPTPLLATLAFMLVCLLVVLGGNIRSRVRARSDR